MAKDLDVTYEEMRNAAKHVGREKEKIDGKLTDLKAFIQGLVEGGFVTKSASKAFNESFQEFIHGMKDTAEGLTGMSDYLTMAADKFEQIDEELGKSAKK
ncbi:MULTISPECIES: WXG100 family type VII secretion target [Streptomyces]|uniref:WXG100 family type VII secretion target n=1 Tax=Streptomyces TaxID=1883 RepID=UPI001BEC5684|nr:WXG100 family type VII secretion target [Streptomyces sp. ISL-100]MBT2399764.1 WXG100 family type VII secretion target [Streptomyces sp. ISL-100]